MLIEQGFLILKLVTGNTLMSENSDRYFRKECLLRILNALSNGMPKLGYVQGLNTIVAVFISQDLKDYEVYWLMKYILKKKKFDGILSDGFPMVQLLNYQLEIYVRHYLPEIIGHLVNIL